MRTLRRSTLTIVAMTLAASPGRTQPVVSDDAAQHLRRGVELTDARNHAAALVEFERARELSPDPRLHYNIAAAHLALGHFVEALESFQRFCDEAPAELVATQRAALDPAMARLRQLLGTLVVALDTPGLVVRVDGVTRDARRARAGLPVSAGRHTLALSAPGRVARDEVVDVASGERVELAAPLAATPSAVSVACAVPDAEVLVDGRAVGRTPLASPVAVDEGPHRVELRRAGYVPFATVVEARGLGARVEAELAWSSSLSPEVAARVVVEASEPDVTASLDGRRIAVDGSDAVPPGAHRLRVERSGYVAWERGVTLPAGETHVARASLTPTPEHRSAMLAQAHAARRDAWVVTGVGALALAAGAVGAVWTTARLDELSSERDEASSRARTCAVTPMLCGGGEGAAARDRAREIDEREIPPLDAGRIASLAGAGAGLAALVVGVVLHLRAPSTERLAATPWRPMALPGGAGVSVSF